MKRRGNVFEIDMGKREKSIGKCQNVVRLPVLRALGTEQVSAIFQSASRHPTGPAPFTSHPDAPIGASSHHRPLFD